MKADVLAELAKEAVQAERHMEKEAQFCAGCTKTLKYVRRSRRIFRKAADQAQRAEAHAQSG